MLTSRPVNDPTRTTVLKQYQGPDAPPEESFDRITRMAAHIFDAPTAFIALLDESRQRIESCVGFAREATDRDISFSAYTILDGVPLLVEDASDDPRFAESPIVTDEPFIRFYAGAPIHTPSGVPLGAVCVMDTAPRRIAPDLMERLEDLAAMAGQELQLRRQTLERAEAEVHAARQRDQWYRFLDSHPDPVLISSDTIIRYANAAAVSTFGVEDADQLCGRTVYDLVAPEHHSAIEKRAEEIQQGNTGVFEHAFIRADGERRIAVSYSTPVEWDGEAAALTVVRDETEAKEREAHLLGLKTALRDMNESVLITDAELDTPGPRILYANEAFETLTGYTEAEAKGRSPRFLQGPETDRAVMDRLRRDLEAGRTFEGETVNYRKDGTPFIMQWSVSPVREPETGDVDRYVAVQRDVTERRKLQDRLRRRAELERLIGQLSTRFINTPPEAVDREIEDALGAVGSFLGVDRSYLFRVHGAGPIDTRVMDNTHEWCAEGVEPQQDSLQDIPCAELPWWMEQMARLEPIEIPDVAAMPPEAAVEKELFEAQDITSLLVVPLAWDNELTGFVGFDLVEPEATLPHNIVTVLQVMADIFAGALRQRAAERALKESEQRFQNLLQSLDDVVWALDMDPEHPADPTKGRLRYNNEATEQVYGYPQEAFFEDPDLWLNATHPEDREMVMAHSEALFETGAVDYEHRIVRPDGEVRWLRNSVRLQYDASGRPIGMGGIGTDITARKRAEEALRATTSRLETMVQHLNGGLLYENEQREILYVNQPFCSLFDIDAPPDALVGTDCAAGTEAAAALMRDPDAFVDTIEARIAAKEPVAGDVIERADGRIYERDFIPVFTDDGVYKGHLWHYRDVTEHRRAEHQLRASKRQLAAEQDFTESVLNTLVDLFMVLTPEGDFVRWNDQLPRVTGYTAEELSTVNMSQFFDRPELERVQAAVSEVLSEGAATVETFLRTKHDGAIPYEFTGSLLSTDDGQELICVVGRDITERKEAEEALQQERDLLESIMDTSVAAIAVADTAGRVIFANERAEAVLRLSATAHRGLPYANLSWILADEEGQPLAPAKHPTQRVVQTGAPLFNVAYRAVWPDGAQRSLAINAAPLTDDAGQVVRVVLSIEDVTERRRAEAALAQSERKYRTLFDASNDAIVLHTPEGEVIDANARMAELFDVPREEIIGGAIRDAHPPEALDAAQAALAELRQEGSVRFQVPCLRHDGSRFWGEISASLIQLNGETVVQGIVRDITAQKRTAEHLQQALEKERELGELKSRFVSMASHELRTPLATIQSSAELAGLFMNRGTGEKADKHLVRIQKNVGKMTELLEDVLLFGRAESGRLPFRPEPVDLGSVARELLRDVRQGLGADHVFEVEGVEAAGTIEADEQLIRLTLSNLLSNAVKYSDAGSTVTVAFERGEDVVRCAVTDAGIGIPEADQERLFEPFHRAENVGTIGGTGLGLSIVKEAVDLHGGSITVESACDEGTTFRVAVPVAPTVPGEAPAQAASA